MLSLCFTACSSSKSDEAFNQQDARSVILRFKQDLDSNNIDAALTLMAHAEGRPYLAVEQYELRDEVARLQRVLAPAKVTNLQSGPNNPSDQTQQSQSNISYDLEFDYQQHYIVRCVRINQRWYICSLSGSTRAQ